MLYFCLVCTISCAAISICFPKAILYSDFSLSRKLLLLKSTLHTPQKLLLSATIIVIHNMKWNDAMMERDDKLKRRKNGSCSIQVCSDTLSKTKRAMLLTKARGLNKWSSSVQKCLQCFFVP